MSLSTICGLLFSAIAFSTLDIGDAGTIITINSAKVTNKANDFFDPWEVEIAQTKKSSQITAKMPTKMELPDSILFQFIAIMDGQDPIEYISTLCEAMDDETIGKSFIEAGIPKDEFPKECPFRAGDWTVMKWDPPADSMPPGVPDGPITGSLMLMEEGKEPFVIIEYEGEIMHSTP